VDFREWAAGQRVRVEYGPFVGAQGVIQRVKKGGHRLIVAIQALKAARSVELDAESLRPVRHAA